MAGVLKNESLTWHPVMTSLRMFSPFSERTKSGIFRKAEFSSFPSQESGWKGKFSDRNFEVLGILNDGMLLLGVLDMILKTSFGIMFWCNFETPFSPSFEINPSPLQQKTPALTCHGRIEKVTLLTWETLIPSHLPDSGWGTKKKDRTNRWWLVRMVEH